MKEGLITKGIGGFYYVKTKDGIIETRARGLFREQEITPLVGDKVKIRFEDSESLGYIEEIMERKSQLVRPPVANITQTVIVVSVKKPEPNLWSVDKIAIMAEHQDLDILFVINKADLDEKRAEEIKDIYSKARYKTVITSVKENTGIEILKESLDGNVSVFAGASGTGKSSLLKLIHPDYDPAISSVSQKTKRGRHTTRHSELLYLDDDTYVLDTPGFSSLTLDFIEEPEELREYYREFKEHSANCYFTSCLHDKEPDCGVKKAVEDGIIPKERYENYLLILDEVRKRRKY